MEANEIIVKITVKEHDLCLCDVKEALEDGFFNVGNLTFEDVKEVC